NLLILSRVFLNYFYRCSRRFAVLRPVFACPSGQLASLFPDFLRMVVYFRSSNHTSCGALPLFGFPQGPAALGTATSSRRKRRRYCVSIPEDGLRPDSTRFRQRC